MWVALLASTHASTQWSVEPHLVGKLTAAERARWTKKMGLAPNAAARLQEAVDKGLVRRASPSNNTFTIPAAFDAASHWPKCAKLINDVRDQGNCGCCWAFAGAEAASVS
jgi:C1A family cysteine protease